MLSCKISQNVPILPPPQVECRRSIKHLLNSFLTQCACNLVLIHQLNVCTIVRVHNSRFTFSCDKPSKTYDEGISRLGVCDFRMYSSSHETGKKATISLLLLADMFYFQRSKGIYSTFEMGVRPLGGHRVGSGFTFRLLQDEHRCRIFLRVARKIVSITSVSVRSAHVQHPHFIFVTVHNDKAIRLIVKT